MTLLIFALPLHVQAQSENGRAGAKSPAGKINVSVLNTQAFPHIQFNFPASDTQGKPLADLTAKDIHILEDGVTKTPLQVESSQSSLQMSVAFSLSQDMGAVGADGKAPFERIRQALTAWAASETTDDDLSLSTPTGLYLIHSKQPQEWSKSLLDYTPDWTKSTPGLTTLSEALNLASDPEKSSSPTRHIVLFITAPIPSVSEAALKDLTARAQQAHVTLFIWRMARPSDTFPSPDPLRQISEATGGQLQDLLPTDALPDLTAALAPLRKSYQVSYSSSIQQSGNHWLSVSVEANGNQWASDKQNFALTVLPPNPIFLSPPQTVHVSQMTAASNLKESINPNTLALQIVIEFPDSFPRDLQSSRLWVDGTLAQEITHPPFDAFSLPLAQFKKSGSHQLRVEVQDILGLTGLSIDVPVLIQVDAPTVKLSSFQTWLNQFGNLSARHLIEIGVAIALAALALGFVLLRGRRKPQPSASLLPIPTKLPAKARKKSKAARKRAFPPIFGFLKRFRKAKASDPVPAPVVEPPKPTLARMVALNEHEDPIPGGTIAICSPETTFGSDSQSAAQVLHSPTVKDFHARLFQGHQNAFFLADQGTIAGTWINYAPVTASGAPLEHGDLIHIGECMFRFELADPALAHPSQAIVYDLENPIPQGASN